MHIFVHLFFFSGWGGGGLGGELEIMAVWGGGRGGGGGGGEVGSCLGSRDLSIVRHRSEPKSYKELRGSPCLAESSHCLESRDP